MSSKCTRSSFQMKKSSNWESKFKTCWATLKRFSSQWTTSKLESRISRLRWPRNWSVSYACDRGQSIVVSVVNGTCEKLMLAFIARTLKTLCHNVLRSWDSTSISQPIRIALIFGLRHWIRSEISSQFLNLMKTWIYIET